MKHMPSAIKPGIYDSGVADENLEIATEDAHIMTLRLAREEGLLVGVSAGAAMVAALKVANRLTQRRGGDHFPRQRRQVFERAILG